MQIRNFELPALSLGDRFEDFPVRAALLYGGYTLVLFLLFLVLNFPYGVLVDQLLDEVDLSPAEVTHGGADLAILGGLRLRGVTVRRSDWTRLPILEIPRADVRVGLSGLLRGKVSKVNVIGDLYGGVLKAKWRGGEDLQRGIVQVEDVQVARYPPLREILKEGQIFGLLSGFVKLEGRPGDVAAVRANGEIYLDRAGSEGLVYRGWPVLDLSFEETSVLFSMQGGRIEIEEFNAVGPDIIMSGSGQIGLRDSLADTVLDLKVVVQAAPDARPEVKGLVSLIPRRRGAQPDAPISISGTVAKPRYR